MFQEVEVANGAVRKSPYFELTRDAFVLIVMGFTGKRALQWKIDYIKAFNRMEATLYGTQAGRSKQLGNVAKRILLYLDRAENILFTEEIPLNAIVGDMDKFRWFAGNLGYLVFKEDELLKFLKGGSK
ncbi:Phage regulatory protein Rha (Phage_pRha) [Sodalis glossinidius str. 'morsitans']|uniref:Phage regulatory protein Rha (Phage_pRha) n=1 Tax=Sodalis glossinidius (strain morsitans) TaxID=343509 RepID=A0A193QL80_SODGM|nr:Rha family transcriptional regulator [Sodalis glossinidius]CRL45848.1 Phage regulatory protein Rha (Phage_pRha) [Sodalis glossinidius str. 'morsitans']